VFGHLAGEPLADPRLSVVQADVVDAIAEAACRYDAILLDVDNGPSAFTTFKNRRLYSAEGLERARRALRPGARLAVWSTFQDASFTARLRAVGFDAAAKRVLAGDGSRRRHVIWLARRIPDE
jgi:spermidine synthase